ncbi:MAG: ATP-binding protein [Hyphomicrobiales bacterium]|nr:ATP-binding protein [Hyphomicrobiales bacterium]
MSATQALVDCVLDPAGEAWSVGHLITVSHRDLRMVGVVVQVETLSGRWSDGEPNGARLVCELTGEIEDSAAGNPVFYRGIRSYPSLGAIVHRIRADDLKAIYSCRGKAGFEIGRLSQNDGITAQVDIRALIARHFAVLGSTGVGKTTTSSMLINQAIIAVPQLRVIILDPHNEYKDSFPDIALVVDSDNLDLPIWMFQFEELADVVFGSAPPNPDQRDALYELIQTVKAKNGADSLPVNGGGMLRRQAGGDRPSVAADTPVPFRVTDAIAIIDEWLGKLDQRYTRSDLRTLRARLDGLSRDPRYRFMFRKGNDEDQLVKVISRLFRIPIGGLPVTIIRLAGLPNEVVNSVVSVMARLAFEIAFLCAGNFLVTLLCEEAHRYIPADHGRTFGPARRALGRIAKEGRKYGASLGVISPRAAELDPTVLSQCSTVFAMRLVNQEDQRIVHGAVGASALSMLLPTIANREAIAFGEALPMPMRMKFFDLALQPKAKPENIADLMYIDLPRLCSQLRGQGDPASG